VHNKGFQNPALAIARAVVGNPSYTEALTSGANVKVKGKAS